jgi:hypothetical protein
VSDEQDVEQDVEVGVEVGVATDARRRRGHQVRRGPIVGVVVAALVLAVVAQQGAQQGASSGSAGSTASMLTDVGVPPAGVVSSAWYCAAGTSVPNGTARETVEIASLARSDIQATVTVMPGGDATPATRTLQLAPGAQVSVPVADVLATAEPGVMVETVGGAAVVSHVLQHGGDVAMEACTRGASADWWFASGTTVEGSQLDLALFNPFGDDAIVDVSFVTDTGAQEPSDLQAMVVARRSRVTVPVEDSVLRQGRVAAYVHARTGRIVAEQTETFDKVTLDGTTRDGIALSAGAAGPATTWRVPVGSTENGGRAQLAVANFTDSEALVDVATVVVGSGKAPPQKIHVPAQSVIDVDVTQRVPLGSQFAVVAQSKSVGGRPVPIVAQLLASWSPTSPSTGVAGTIGSTLTADRWVVPRPAIGGTATITVFNPGPGGVTASLLPADQVDRTSGPTSEPELAVAPGSAQTISITRVNGSAAVVVTAEHPIVVGLTVLGRAGTAMSTAVPDLSHGA